jgi:hypothetical protein
LVFNARLHSLVGQALAANKGEAGFCPWKEASCAAKMHARKSLSRSSYFSRIFPNSDVITAMHATFPADEASPFYELYSFPPSLPMIDKSDPTFLLLIGCLSPSITAHRSKSNRLFENQRFNFKAGACTQPHPKPPTLFRLLGCFSPSMTARAAASSFSLSKATASGSSSSHFICSSTGAKVASANEDLPVPPTWRVSVRCIRIWSMSSSPKLAAACSAASSCGSKSLLHERMSARWPKQLLRLVRCISSSVGILLAEVGGSLRSGLIWGPEKGRSITEGKVQLERDVSVHCLRL